MGFSSPTPPSVGMPPPAAHPPTMASAMVATAGRNAETVANASGRGGTVKTSTQGLKEKPSTAPVTLLGQ